MRKLLRFALLAGLLPMASSVTANDLVPVVSGEAMGAWMGEFSTATDFARRTNRPLVLLWTSDICYFCELLEQGLAGAEFKKWMADSPYAFAFIEGTVENSHAHDVGVNAGSGAYDFARTAAGTRTDPVSSYPIVCLYWPKAPGEVVVKSFTGRNGSMPVKTGTLAEQLEASVDEFFAEYRARRAWRFGVTDAPADRYEAEASTAYVDVKILRDLDLTAGTPKIGLKIEWPDGVVATEVLEMIWAADEVSRKVRIPLDRGEAAFPAGRQVSLTIFEEGGSALAQGAIHFVEPCGNSPENPHWVGEYSAAELPWGEWTFDYPAALEKIQSGGHLLAMFSGVLWCPHCIGIERSLFAADNEEFRRWAKDNKVALVLFDQPRAGLTAPRLLCDEQDPNKRDAESVSGNGYLSRRMLDAGSDAVRTVNDRQARKTVEWLAPESTAARLSNPTILLIRKDETVAGRLQKCETDGNFFATDEHLGRLDDFLLLDGEGDESQGFASTTELAVPVGGSASATFQISERTKFFKVTGVTPGYIRFAVKPGAAQPLTLSVMTADKVVLASDVDCVMAKIRPSDVSKGVFLRAVAYPVTTARICADGATSRFTAEISSEFVPTGGDGELDGPGFDPDGKPCLGWPEYAIDLWKDLPGRVSLNVANVEGATSIKVKRISGRLPSGVSVAYDETSGRVVLKGTPTRLPKEPVVLTYAITAKIGGKTVVGAPTTLTITISDPKAANETVSRVWNVMVPLYAGGKVAATLKVAQTSANKLSANFRGTRGGGISFSGTWDSLDEQTGIAESVLTKKGTILQLGLDSKGILSATVANIPSSYSPFADVGEFGGSLSVVREPDYVRYAGDYSVSLPNAGGEMTQDPTDGEFRIPLGSASVRICLSSKSAQKSGRATYSGRTPTGKSFSGSFNIVSASDSETADLLVFARTGKESISCPVTIACDGSQKWCDFSGDDTIRQVVNAKDGTMGFITFETASCKYMTFHDVAGSWYPGTLKVYELVQFLYGRASQVFALTLQDGSECGTVVGRVAYDGRKFGLVEKVRGLTFSVSKNGLFSGALATELPGIGPVRGTYRGILVPGWFESCNCGEGVKTHPFGGAAFCHSRKIGKKYYGEGLLLELVAEDQDR